MNTIAPILRSVFLPMILSALFGSGFIFWPAGTWLLLALLVLLLALHLPTRMHTLVSLLLISISLFPMIFFFDYRFDTSGEVQRLYLRFLENNTTPLQEGYRFFYLEPAVFVTMHYFAEILGANPVAVVKLARVVIGALEILIVYYLGKGLTIKDQETHKHSNALPVFGAAIFAFHYNQLWYLGGDQFKNLLGHLFFLGFLYFFLLPRGKKLSVLLFLYACAAFSHRLYIFLIPLMLIGLFINEKAEKFLGKLRRLAPLLTCAIIVLGLRIGLSIIPTYYVDLFGIGYAGMFEGGMETIPISWELIRPGLALYNMWGLGLLFGYFLMYKSVNKNAQLKVLYLWFFLIFVLSKMYLFGIPFVHGRFMILLPAFQSILTGYILWKLFAHDRMKIVWLFFIIVTFWMLSFSIVNFGGEYYGRGSGRIVTHIMALDFDPLFTSTFGEMSLDWVGMIDLLFGGAIFVAFLGLAIFNRLNSGIILMLLAASFFTIFISRPIGILRWINFFSLFILSGYLLKDLLLASEEGADNLFLCPLLGMGYISLVISVIWLLNPSIATSGTKLIALMVLSGLFVARIVKKQFSGRYPTNRGSLPSDLKTVRRKQNAES